MLNTTSASSSLASSAIVAYVDGLGELVLGNVDFILLIIYIVIGPVAWLVMFGLLMLGRRRMTRLLSIRAALPDEPPHVTILMPAKDEAGGITSAIESCLRQEYPCFNVIAVDDRSTDGTGAILDELARQHPDKLSVIHVAPGALPEGWLGKCHALHVAARHADGQWLLLVDSDVTLRPEAMSRAVALAASRRYDALSILTRLECHSFRERLILPLVGGTWAVMNAISLTNDDRRRASAAANGQFFLIRRSAYEAVGGHESVRSDITEDVEMMRLLKGRGFRTRLMLGAHLAATRMHSSLGQMFHGWGRILSGSTRRRPTRIIGAILFILICGLSVYPALAWGILAASGWDDVRWLAASVAHLLLMTGYLAYVYRGSGNPMRNAWLFPVSGGVLVAILCFALRTCRTGRVKWRDTHFQIPVHGRTQKGI